MSGQNPTAAYTQTNYAGPGLSTYLSGVDANTLVATRFVDNFAPRAQTSPDMTIHLDAGHLYNGSALVEVAAQNSGTITVPAGSNKRIDRAVIDNLTGTLSIVTGTPTTGTPAVPAIPAGKSPVCQIGTTGSPLLNGTTSITNSMLTDERDFSVLGAGYRITDNSSTASYTYVSADKNHVKVRSNSGSAMTDTLPVASATFPQGWMTTVINADATAPLTITPTTSTIDGAATLVLAPGSGCDIFSDGSNYVTNRGGGAALKASQTFAGAQIAGNTALTSSSNHIALNLALNNDFTHTFTENTTLDNPTNIVAGQSGRIFFTQHASSPKTLAFGSKYKFPNGTVPTVTAANGAIDVLYYDVLDSTHIAMNLVKGFA